MRLLRREARRSPERGFAPSSLIFSVFWPPSNRHPSVAQWMSTLVSCHAVAHSGLAIRIREIRLNNVALTD
jgi:hypothetical protein